MTSIDFAAAQQRIAARRAARVSEQTARTVAEQNEKRTALSRLPIPLGPFGRGSIDIWDAVKGREGTRPAFRVGQVDADLLDEELFGLFQGQVGEALKYFGVC